MPGSLQRKQIKIVARGLGLASPPDLLPEGLYPILNNVQATQQGALTTRPPVSIAVPGPTGLPILVVKRLNDPTTSTFARVASDGTNLLTGANTLTVAESGFSGNRPSVVTLRPDRSPQPFSYIYDKNKLRKVNAAGVVSQIGIVPPQNEPLTALGPPNITVANDFTSAVGWTNSGTAGAVTVVNRTSTTIANILYDTGLSGGTTGWACVNLAVMDSNVQQGMRLNLGGTEQVLVHGVFTPFANTTLASIIYDVGTTGLCSATLTTTPSVGFSRNALIQFNTESLRILSVTIGSDNTYSLRCLTLINHVAGEPVTSIPSCRVYTVLPHLAGETVVNTAFSSTVTIGTGSIQNLSIPLDLSTAGGRPLTIDDYMHISIALDAPGNLVEGRFALDIDSATNDFQHNAYYFTFRPSDFQNSAAGTQTLLESQALAQQNAIWQGIFTPEFKAYETSAAYQSYVTALRAANFSAAAVKPVASAITSPFLQITTGASQWTEFKIKLSSLIRVGADNTRTLANVKSLLVQLNVVGTVTLRVSSWYVSGSYGPDVYQTSTPMFYGYRYRSTNTGATSNMSPAVRNGDYPQRERMSIAVVASPDPQVDKIDICRFGGSVNSWRLALTVPNVTGLYNDDSTVTAITAGDLIAFDNYVPFPTSDLPHHGTCNVSGTTVQWVSGDLFDTRWVTGSLITINNLAYTLSRSPNSTTVLQTIESVGNLTNVTFLLSEPTLYGTNLPYTWDGGTQNSNVVFGCGDPLNPGYLYWSKPGAPDTASDTSNVEVTSPTEPLLGGFNYDGRGFCFSSEHLFMINSATPLGSQTVNFVAQVIPTGKGIPYPFFFAIGPTTFYGSRDGISSWSGAASTSITDDSLFPIFPHKGTEGIAVNGYLPVDINLPITLNYTNDSLYLFYADNSHARQCLLYELVRGGWFPYSFTSTPMYCAYQEEGVVNSVLLGGGDGNLYTYDVASTEVIQCHIRTFCVDYGDSRSQKLFADYMLDADGTFTPRIFYNNFATSTAFAPFTLAGRGQVPIDIATTGLELHLNSSLDLTWTGKGTVYEFQPSAFLQPFFAPVFISQATDHGYATYGHLRESRVALISTDTVGLYAIVDGVERLLFNIPSTGGKFVKYYSPTPVVKGKLILYKAVSATPFLLFPDETTMSAKEWGSPGPYQPFRAFAGITNG